MTECTQSCFSFAALYRREVVAQFDGGDITTDAGGLLLREVDRRLNITQRLAACFVDYRRPDRMEHTVGELVGQRLYGLALGYEDLNDHDQLRADPLLAVLIGKAEPKGGDRRRVQDQGKAGAGKSTLNRLELTPADADAQARYKKIVHETGAMDQLLTELFLESYEQPPSRIVLDLMPPMIRCTGIKRDGFFTAIIENIAIYLCISYVGSSCCVPGCGVPTSMPQRGRWMRCSGLWPRSARNGRRWRLCCVVMVASAAIPS